MGVEEGVVYLVKGGWAADPRGKRGTCVVMTSRQLIILSQTRTQNPAHHY